MLHGGWTKAWSFSKEGGKEWLFLSLLCIPRAQPVLGTSAHYEFWLNEVTSPNRGSGILYPALSSSEVLSPDVGSVMG